MEPETPAHPHCCQCEGNCLEATCPCFRKAHYCENCKCEACRNKMQFETERTTAFENILLTNPLAFTSEDSLNQEEFSAISNFAMLTNSVDTEQFKLVDREKQLAKVLRPNVLKLSIVTILSAANEALTKSTDQAKFEEEIENSMAAEFHNILKQVEKNVE